MRRASELSKFLLKLIEEKNMKQETLAAAIGKARQTLNKKLHGKVPWYYEEVVAISELLEMPDLACSGTPSPKATIDPGTKALMRRIQLLPAEDRRRFFLAAEFMLKGKLGKRERKRQKEQARKV